MEDIIVKIDTDNLGMSGKEVIQGISELGQANSFFQAENHLDYPHLGKAADTFEKYL